MENKQNNKLHQIAITCIIRKDGKYLICKRSPEEKAFPNKWCVPGGRLEQDDFQIFQKDTKDYWLDILENALRREVKEETNLEIKNIQYVSNLAFMRPDNIPTIIISMAADYKSGEINLNQEELVDYKWINLEEAREYDLLETLYEQIEKVEEKTKKILLTLNT